MTNADSEFATLLVTRLIFATGEEKIDWKRPKIGPAATSNPPTQLRTSFDGFSVFVSRDELKVYEGHQDLGTFNKVEGLSELFAAARKNAEPAFDVSSARDRLLNSAAL